MYKDYEIKLNAILDKHGVQKVELENIAELKKALNIVKKEFQMMDGNKKIFLKEIEAAKKSLWVDADQAEKQLNRVIHPILNKFDKAAKDLGMKATVVPEYNKLVKERDRLEDRIVKQKKEYR
tara:strand:+ start:369 stop:737 length:369 start_codon:yes stop_codon:yes gene_type:complete